MGYLGHTVSDYFLRGRSHIKLLALHNQYGTAVRVGPNELSLNCPQALRDIYQSPQGRLQFPKDPKLYASDLIGMGKSVAGNVDNAAHGKQRPVLSRAFSEKYPREQEETIVYFVDLLVQRLRSVE